MAAPRKKVKKSRKVPAAQKPRKSSNVKKKASAASRVIYRINGRFSSKKQWQQYEKNRKARERRKETAPKIPKFRDVKKKRKPRNYAKTEDGKLKGHAVADLSTTLLQVEVTSQKERYTEIHMELRKKAIEKGRFFVPDSRTREISTPFNKGLHQSFQVGKFLTEETVEDITAEAYVRLVGLEKKQIYGKARFYIAFHMTEYGLETYGSDKGSIATKDGISTDTLHWTAWGSAAAYEPEAVHRMARIKLQNFLKKSSRTTIAIESIDVTMIYERSGEGN